MRVISGKYKGRELRGFDIDGTRPTMDRVKESMFAMIQDKINGSVCLDLFAGSGALGIEAISNGSSKTYFVDNSKEAINILKYNLSKVDDNYEIINNDYNKALKHFKDNNVKFDIVLLDPPYQKLYINKIITSIIDNELLNRNGIIVTEYEQERIDNEHIKLLKEKKYGAKTVGIYGIFDNN